MEILRSLEGLNFQDLATETFIRSYSCPYMQDVRELKFNNADGFSKPLSSRDWRGLNDGDGQQPTDCESESEVDPESLGGFDNYWDIEEGFDNISSNTDDNNLTLELNFEDEDSIFIQSLPMRIPLDEEQELKEIKVKEIELKKFNEQNYLNFKHGQLGLGASALVTKSLQLSSCEIVAIKKTASNSLNAKQIMNEIKWMSLLNENKNENENIIKMIDYGYDNNNGDINIVLQYMNAGSLKNFIESHSPMSESFIQHIAYQIAQGLYKLHNHRVEVNKNGIKHTEIHPLIHNDLKPENILISLDGKIKISDFGLMKELNSEKELCCDSNGTIKYFSPERLHGNGYNSKSDIYSFGLLLYECAYGMVDMPQYDNKSPSYVMDSSKYSALCRDFISQCLKMDVNDRFSAKELLEHEFLQSYTGIDMIMQPNDEELTNIINLLSDYFSNRSFLDDSISINVSDSICLNNIAKSCGVTVAKVRKKIIEVVNSLKLMISKS